MSEKNIWEETHNPKAARLRGPETRGEALPCMRCLLKNANLPHSADCPEVTVEELRLRLRMAQSRNSWLERQSQRWLRAVQDMHGKVDRQRHELQKLRCHRARGETTHHFTVTIMNCAHERAVELMKQKINDQGLRDKEAIVW